MPPLTLEAVAQAVRRSWNADTCDPTSSAEWKPDNPSRDQCGTTALVLNDLFGGALILADVHVNGEKTGHHYWNVLGSGIEVDMTRDQFAPHEHIVGRKLVERPPGPPNRCAEQYALLRRRVFEHLGIQL